MKCTHCERNVKEVCKDGYCKTCHVSCSWKDCQSGQFEKQIVKQFIGKANKHLTIYERSPNVSRP